MITAVMGVDPGADGAAFVISPQGDLEAVLRFHKVAPLDAVGFFKEALHQGAAVFVEKIHALPGNSASTSFKMGLNLGQIEGTLRGLGAPFTHVAPQRWQHYMGLGKAFPTKNMRKNAHKTKASELLPGYKFTLADADAFLIAEYGRRILLDI